MQHKKLLSREAANKSSSCPLCPCTSWVFFSTLFPIQQLNRFVSENKMTENSTSRSTANTFLSKTAWSPEAHFFLPFPSKHSASSFCWALPSLFLSFPPHLSLQRMCRHPPVLHSTISLKQLLQGTTHRHPSWFLSLFLTQETHKLMQSDNLHHSNSSKFNFYTDAQYA